MSTKNAIIEIFPWNDNFNTEIPLIDEQHKQLVLLILHFSLRHTTAKQFNQTRVEGQQNTNQSLRTLILHTRTTNSSTSSSRAILILNTRHTRKLHHTNSYEDISLQKPRTPFSFLHLRSCDSSSPFQRLTRFLCIKSCPSTSTTPS